MISAEISLSRGTDWKERFDPETYLYLRHDIRWPHTRCWNTTQEHYIIMTNFHWLKKPQGQDRLLRCCVKTPVGSLSSYCQNIERQTFPTLILSWLNLQDIVNYFLCMFSSTLVNSFIFNSNLLGDFFFLKIKKKNLCFYLACFYWRCTVSLCDRLLFPLLLFRPPFLFLSYIWINKSSFLSMTYSVFILSGQRKPAPTDSRKHKCVYVLWAIESELVHKALTSSLFMFIVSLVFFFFFSIELYELFM